MLRPLGPRAGGIRTETNDYKGSRFALPGTRNAGPLFSEADIIRKSCAAILKASIRSASTSNGGSSSGAGRISCLQGDRLQVSAVREDGEAVDKLIKALTATKALLPEKKTES